LVFDSDKAGEAANLRALDLLLENDLKVKIARLPDGFDPDSLVRKNGGDAFRAALSTSSDFFEYKVSWLKNMYDIQSIAGKTKIAQEMFSTLGKLSSEIEKYEYLKKLAFVLGVKEEILIAEFKQFFSKSRERDYTTASVLTEKEPLSITEKTLIKFMLTNHKAFSLIKRSLNEEDFTSVLARKTVSYFFKNYPAQIDMPSLSLLSKIEDKEISSFISRILIDDDTPLSKEVFKESMLKIRQKRIKNIREKLRQEIKTAEDSGDKEKLKLLMGKYTNMGSKEKNV
jgi:DNA primase